MATVQVVSAKAALPEEVAQEMTNLKVQEPVNVVVEADKVKEPEEFIETKEAEQTEDPKEEEVVAAPEAEVETLEVVAQEADLVVEKETKEEAPKVAPEPEAVVEETKEEAPKVAPEAEPEPEAVVEETKEEVSGEEEKKVEVEELEEKTE